MNEIYLKVTPCGDTQLTLHPFKTIFSNCNHCVICPNCIVVDNAVHAERGIWRSQCLENRDTTPQII